MTDADATLKVLDASELEELYDDFLNLDPIEYPDLSLDSNLTDSGDEEATPCKTDFKERYPHFTNNNNNNHLLTETALDFHLDLLNKNLDLNLERLNGNYLLDKNGKVQVADARAVRPTSLFVKTKEDESELELKEVDERRSSPGDAFLLDPQWGPESLGMWRSGPSSLGFNNNNNNNQDASSVISFTSSLGSGNGTLAGSMAASRRTYSQQQLGAKVEMVYNLLSMLGTSDREDMSKTLLAMSSSPESCQAMRQSGCLPLLTQLIHSPELDAGVRARAAEALRNLVHAQTDEKRRRREIRVLKLLQQVRDFCEQLRTGTSAAAAGNKDDSDQHPGPAIAALMKFSFDEEHRQAMCTLGGLHAIAELIQLDHEVHGSSSEEQLCITLRRYAGMALTNLTFGDGNNKALLCSLSKFMKALVAQLTSPSEDLRQVTASVFRNLSWRADAESKGALREVGAVAALMAAAMEGKKESTLKSILSALWNLSAHCSMNKVDVCAVPGALAFLVRMLRYKATSSTLAIIENAGGILRNVSSHVAVREDYRQVLRDNNCFEVLLEQLKSPSLTIVSNACGTLWNLSARCSEDQRRLWEMGAASMLRSLVQSKHKMISMGSSAALKNLLTANPGGNMLGQMDSTARGLGLQNLPTLFVRKQRALEQELDVTLAETCDNIEQDKSRGLPRRSDSRESVTSTQSDSVFERVRHGTKPDALDGGATLHGSLSECQPSGSGKKYDRLVRRCKASMIPTPALKKLSQEKKNERRKEEDQQERAASTEEEEPEGRSRKRRGIPVLKTRLQGTKRDSSNSPSPLKYAPSPTPCYGVSELEEETVDQPVDYSLKYTEKPPLDRVYAETDLDQPTDFSLRYGEESSDEDGKGRGEDTTRTYCTEGTPYEGTPFNFSSATSLSDLRVDGVDDISKECKRPEELEASKAKPQQPSSKKTPQSDAGADKRLSREYESGVSTPERPVQYCEEGTPGDCFSRVSSLSSLSGGKGSPDKKTEKKPTPPSTQQQQQQEKVVTFVDETPLMFSRCSSINSLSSFDQVNQLTDDRSSVVSDLSRLTSGAVSPSELPDSPTQTVPPSPRRLAQQQSQHHAVVPPQAKPSVFEDQLAMYKQEGTPVEFSRATSLSSLTIDSATKPEFSKHTSSGSSVVSNEGGREQVKDQIVPERLELTAVSEGEESMLQDCISQGMPDSARLKPRVYSSKHVPKPVNPLTAQWKPPPQLQQQPPRSRVTSITARSHGKYHATLDEEEDVMTTYHTEGTPLISHAGSHSDLTAPAQLHPDDCSDEGSSFTEDILAECIQSAMPKSKPTKPTSDMGQALHKSSNITAKNVTPSTNHLEKAQLGGCYPARDETVMFVTENSPCNFSIVSSLSDLTIDSSANQSRAGASNGSSQAVSPANASAPHAASPSSISLIGSEDGGKGVEEGALCLNVKVHPSAHDVSFASVASSADTCHTNTADLVTALSRNPSLSSLSVESFDSCEPTPLEQALLEQCIHSGMPNKNHRAKAYKIEVDEFAPSPPPTKNVMATSVCDTAPAADGGNGGRGTSKEDAMVASGGGHTWSEDYTSPTSLGTPSMSGSEKVEGLRLAHLSDSDSSKKLLPNFRIGSEISCSKFLHSDASKICRELRKYQELDTSCSSFLDAAEISTFEVPNDPLELFDPQRRLKSIQQPVSLPSLNTKPELLDGLDLEGSMISVASITSEIAEVPKQQPAPDLEDTLMGSDTELLEDENSIISQENLPLDPEPNSFESTPKVTARRMTPKERRQSLQERYRTYTIRDLEKQVAEERKPKNRITPKQRRLEDKERFRTRVLGKEDTEQLVHQEVEAEDAEEDTVTLGVEKDVSLRCEGSLRFKTWIVEPERTVISQELLDNATLVAKSLWTAARDKNDSDLSVVSDTEADFSLGTLPIDTATYTSEEKPRHRPYSHPSGKEVQQTEEKNEDDEEIEKKGPKILKPGEKLELEEEEPEQSPRGVRGRRKKLYSSPCKKPLMKLVSSTPSSPKHAQTERKANALTPAKSMPNVPKCGDTPVLCREGTFTKEEARPTRTSRSIPVLAKKPDPAPVTRTTAAVRNKSSPSLRGPAAGKAPGPVRPVSSYTTRSATIAAEMSHKRHNSAGASSSNSKIASNVVLRRQSSAGPTVSMKNSPSNQSIKSNSSAKSMPATSSKTSTSPDTAKGKPKTPKKEVTSKIASLWKRVEETKKKDGKCQGVDKRVWITGKETKDAESDTGEVKEAILEREEIVELSSGKIVRSSTLEGFEQGSVEQSTNRSEVKVSAIVPPYNYNTPHERRAATTPTNVKQPLDHFHKTSMKVTTV